jgi:hypothetical protein
MDSLITREEKVELGESLENVSTEVNEGLAPEEVGEYLAQLNHSLTREFIGKASGNVTITDADDDESPPLNKTSVTIAKKPRGRPKKVVSFTTPTFDDSPKSDGDYKRVGQQIADRKIAELEAKSRQKDLPEPPKPKQKHVSYVFGAETEDDPELTEKLKVLKRLDLSYKYYPQLLEGCARKKPWDLNCSLKTLQEEEKRVEFEKNTESALEILKKLDILVHFGIEKVCTSAFDVRAEGLAKRAAESQAEALETLQSLSIKYGHHLVLSPESKYIIRVIQNAATVIQMNNIGMTSQKRAEYDSDHVGSSPPGTKMDAKVLEELMKTKYGNL